MQKLVAHWEGLLQAMGALIPNRCFWYFIDQQWINGKWQYTNMTATSMQLSVVNFQGKLTKIPCLEASAQRTLGMRIAPDGNLEEEFNYLSQ